MMNGRFPAFEAALERKHPTSAVQPLVDQATSNVLIRHINGIRRDLQEAMNPDAFTQCRHRVLANELPTVDELQRAFEETMMIGAFCALKRLVEDLSLDASNNGAETGAGSLSDVHRQDPLS